MPNVEWFTKQGPDGQWYKTQASSQEEALAKMQGAWGGPKLPPSVVPQPNIWAKAGTYVPEAALAPLEFIKKWDPFERMATTGAEVGGKVIPKILDTLNPVPASVSAQYPKTAAVAHGVETGIGKFVGGLIADPRNWPLLGSGAARPLLQRLITLGFQGMMTKGTYDAAKDLYDNWDKYTPQQRAERGTQAGLSAVMTAALFKGRPAPENTTIAASGKTEIEAKAETAPPPKRELTADQIRARIAELEAKAKTRPITPVENVKQIAGQEDVVEQIRRGAPPEVKPEAPLPNQVPEEQRPSKLIAKEQQEKVSEQIAGRSAAKADLEAKPVPKAPEARDELPPEPIETIQQRVARISQQAKIELAQEGVEWWKGRKGTGKASTPEGKIDWVQPSSLEAAQMEMKQRQTIAQAKTSETQRLLEERRLTNQKELDALRDQTTERPEVGRTAPPSEAPKPEVKPVQAAEAPKGPGEPIRPATGPEVDWPKTLSVGQKESDWFAKAKQELFPNKTGLTIEDISKISARGLELRAQSEKAAPLAKRVLNAVESLQLQRQIVEELRAKNPGVATARLQEMAVEKIRQEHGIVGGGGRDLERIRADREEKISGWIKTLQDLKADPGDQDMARKMLKAYGLTGKEIAERMGDVKGLAKTIEEHGPSLQSSQEALEERIGDPRTFSTDSVEDIIRDTTALVEGRSVGRPEIEGVKSPAVEALEKLHALKDTRKTEREDERGSLSFKPISREEREAASPIRRLADFLDRLAPEKLATQQTAENIIRGAEARQARSRLEIEKALEEHIERHDNPTNERQNFIDFMDAGEGKEGAKFLEPKDQAVAQWLHEEFQDRWEKIKEAKGLEGDGIENYLSHMWEKPGKAQQILRGLLTGRRPLEGRAGFLKSRYYEYASDGVAHGLTPITWNPIRLQLGALFDMDRFLKAHEIKDRYRAAGIVQFGHYKDMPAGWQPLDDKIFAPKIMKDGGLVDYGDPSIVFVRYYAPPDVAKVFNRHLSPGLQGNPVYRDFRKYGNVLNSIELGFSGFHAMAIHLVAQASDFALGLQKVFNYGDFKGGMQDILKGSFGNFVAWSTTSDAILGRRIRQEAIEPTGNPALQRYVDMITQGGGRFEMDRFWQIDNASRKGFYNWLRLGKEGKFTEMAMTGVRKSSAWLMEGFVPNVKLGIAARMMEAKMAHLEKLGIHDSNTIATEMGKIWDSVDNRAGQLVYPNLFWNKTAKDLSLVGIRAVGWNYGSLREAAGGIFRDLPQQAAKALRGERPELTHRISFLISYPIVVGMMGAAVHYLMTGKPPRNTADCYYPGPDGEKVSIAGYMRDFFSWKRAPIRTVMNKVHPVFNQLATGISALFGESDMFNTDFYGTEIWHPGDPLLKRGWDYLKYFGKTWEPLAVTGLARRIERGDRPLAAIESLGGFMPASSQITASKAEQLATELTARPWHRTSEEADRHTLVERYKHQAGMGRDVNMDEVDQAFAAGKLRASDVVSIYDSFKVPKLQRDFKALEIPDALAVMREATPEERIQLKPLLAQKYSKLLNYPPDQQDAYEKEILAYLQ